MARSFIILDEPTAQLDGEEIKRLFAQMRRLQAQGVTFLFISHHLQEVYEVCQTVTVLRDAKHILTAPAATLPKDALIEAMTGEQVSFAFADAANRKPPTEGPVALEVSRLERRRFRRCELFRSAERGHRTVRRDQQRPPWVAEAVAGLGPYTSPARSGSTAQPSARAMFPQRLRLASAACRKAGTARASFSRNRSPTMSPCRLRTRLGRSGSSRPHAAPPPRHDAIHTLGVVTQGPDQLVSDLSGGNQQKVVMGRALSSRPSVLVLIDPTAGVDVKSKEALLRVIENTRRDGRAILVASGELEDLRVCDRVLVMRHGKVVAEHAAGWSDNELVASVEGI